MRVLGFQRGSVYDSIFVQNCCELFTQCLTHSSIWQVDSQEGMPLKPPPGSPSYTGSGFGGSPKRTRGARREDYSGYTMLPWREKTGQSFARKAENIFPWDQNDEEIM